MPNVFTALARSMRDLAQPRILALLFLPMLVAVMVWSALGVFFWDTWTGAFRGLISDTGLARWLVQHGATWIVESVGVVLVLALLLPAIVITAVILTELFAMPAIVSVVARQYPHLERRTGGTLFGSVMNAAAAILIFALLWVLTLPLWLTGIGAVVLPALLAAYLSQRLFRYDALAEHASRDEYLHIVKRHKLRLFGFGLLLAPLYYVPLVNLAAPVIAGLAFTHLCLSVLTELRRGR